MLKWILLFSELFFLTACGNPVMFNTYWVDPAFVPYVEEFKAELDARGIPHTPYLVMQFGNIQSTEAANCQTYDGGGLGVTPIVTVNVSDWNVYGDSDRKEVVFHELGHGWLNILRHDDNYLYTGLPESVMNTYHFDGILFATYYDYYVQQEVELAGYNNFKGD